jgi:sacsin
MAGSGAARTKWNEALLTDALAPAYARLLLEMSVVTGPSEQALYR